MTYEYWAEEVDVAGAWRYGFDWARVPFSVVMRVTRQWFDDKGDHDADACATYIFEQS